jgi:hypothetical protein
MQSDSVSVSLKNIADTANGIAEHKSFISINLRVNYNFIG